MQVKASTRFVFLLLAILSVFLITSVASASSHQFAPQCHPNITQVDCEGAEIEIVGSGDFTLKVWVDGESIDQISTSGDETITLTWSDYSQVDVCQTHTLYVELWSCSKLGSDSSEFGGASCCPAIPQVTVTKTLLNTGPIVVGQEVHFRIRVKNTGDTTLALAPLQDWYDPTQFEFLRATPAADDNVNDGVIDWGDLTQPGDKGFDKDLPPDSFFDVFVDFKALKPTKSKKALALAGLPAADHEMGTSDENGGTDILCGASIGDRVFYDLDGSGSPDGGTEPGINGVTVNLYQGSCPGSGQPYRSQVTAGNGDYDFTDLTEGDYCVAVDGGALLAGWGVTTPDPMDVSLGCCDDFNDADFGYAVQCPSETAPNEAVSVGARDEHDRFADPSADYACVKISPHPEIAISKTVVGSDDVSVGEEVVFSIVLTNTGDADIDALPFQDVYDPDKLQFLSATPAPDSVADGVLKWDDLTTTFGDLSPQRSIALEVHFRALASTSTTVVALDRQTGFTPAQAPGLPQSPTCTIELTPHADCDGWSIEFSGSNYLGVSWRARVDDTVIDTGETYGNETVTGQWPDGVDMNAAHTFTAEVYDDCCGCGGEWVGQSTTFGSCIAPEVTLTKTADKSSAKLGDVIVYTYDVENTGTESLTGLTLSDDKLGGIALSQTSLEPGQSVTATASYTVQASDAPGPIVNTAIVTGATSSGVTVQSADDASVKVDFPLQLEADKRVTPGMCENASIDLVVRGAGYGEPMPLDVILVLDRSGSMEGDPLDDLKDAAKLLVDALDDTRDRVGLVSYASSASLDSGLTSNFNAVKSAIDAMHDDGYTNIGDGVYKGRTELATHGRQNALQVLVVMSDGVANRSHDGGSCTAWPTTPNACTDDAINQSAAAKAAGVTLFTVGLNLDGVEENHTGSGVLARNVLKAMASSTDNYFESPTSDELSDIFQDIANTFSNIAGRDVQVIDILPEGVNYVPGSATPAPTQVSGQTLIWEFSQIKADETVTITLDITLDHPGPNQLVDVYPDSLVTYTNFQGEQVSVPFPETRMTPEHCAVIGDFVWYDADGDGAEDAAEPGVSHVSLTLRRDENGAPGAVVANRTTNRNGIYLFDFLPAGTYWVEVTDVQAQLTGLMHTVGPDSKLSPFGPIAVDNDEVYDQADFGYRYEEPGRTCNWADVSDAIDVYDAPVPPVHDSACVKIDEKRGAIGDFIWYDADGDGIEDVGEPGLANIAVDLYRDSNGNGALDSGDQVVASTQSDADGGYLFTKLPPGDYFVDVTDADNPNGDLGALVHTLGGQSKPDAFGPIHLTAGEVYKDADFGYVHQPAGKAVIGDTVWYDANGDGIQQPGEPGIPGVTVMTEPEDSAVSPQTALTDENGHYWFSVLPGGYKIKVTPPAGLSATTPTVHGPVQVTAGEKYLRADFGFTDNEPGAIGDLIFEDANENGVFDAGEAPLAGVSVDLIRDKDGDGVWDAGEPVIATTTTTGSLDANGGNYRFSGLPAGHYLVHVSDANGVLLDYNRGPLGTSHTNNNSQPDPYPVHLANPGDADLTADFGYVPLSISDRGVIGNQVWLEHDNDGIFAPFNGDRGQPGVTVELLVGDDVIATTTTGASGDYAFVHLPAGAYRVRVNDAFGVLTGFASTAYYPADQSSDNTNKRQPYAVNLPAGGVNLTADFGYLCHSRIQGYLWRDENIDGVWDASETPLKDIEVALLADTPGRPLVALTRTDANGFYLFDDLDAGDYVIDVNNGYINNNLQIFLTTPPEPAFVSLGRCDVRYRDFGYGPKTGVIGNFVWYDVNQNAKQDEWYDANDNDQYDEWQDVDNDNLIDEGELDKCGLRLVPITLKDANGNPLQETMTDYFGFYNFVDLPGGTYLVHIDRTILFEQATAMALDGKCKPLPASAPLPPAFRANALPDGDVLFDLNVNGTGPAPNSAEQTLAVIHGQVREDTDADGDFNDPDPGMAGVTIELYVDVNGDGLLDIGDTLAASTVTDGSGFYTFAQQAAGRYIVVENDPNGFGSTADTGLLNDNKIPLTLGANDSTGNDFLDTIVSCYLDPEGDIIVHLPPGGIYLDADFASFCVYGPGAIGDFVWYDANGDGVQDVGEPGIDNVTVALFKDIDGDGSGDMLVDTTVTGADGGYLFHHVPPGYYVVDVTDSHGRLAGLTLTSGPQTQPDPSNRISLTSGQVFKDADFGYGPPDDGKVVIGDTVWYDADGDGFQQPWEIGIPNVTVQAVNLSGGSFSAVTDGNGHYRIVAPPGNYTVTPTPPAGLAATTPAPVKTGLLLPGDSYLDADFGYRNDDFGVIGNLVFEDANENGRFDAGDSPLAGVSVDLIRDSNGDHVWDAGEPVVATTITTNTLDASNGNYWFAVPAGNYLVHVSDVNGVLINFVKAPLGVVGVDNNNQNDPYALTLAAGAQDLTADFGYVKIDRPNTGVIGNHVWIDANGDGLYDPSSGDVGQPGVTVDLYRDGGYYGATTTGASGGYSFTSLPSGTYTVTVSDTHHVLSHYTPAPLGPAPGADNNNQAQPYAIALAEKAIDLTADFGYLGGGSTHAQSSIGDLVWLDINGDGVHTGDEPGIGNVTVELWYDMDSDGVLDTGAGGDALTDVQTTSGSGGYLFSEELPTGDYLVRVTDQNNVLAAYTPTTVPNSHANDDSKQQPYAITNFNPTGAGNDSDLTADFGYAPPSTDYDITKTLIGDWQVRPGDDAIFQIVIVNTGGSWLAEVPLRDDFNPEYLLYKSADAAPDTVDNAAGVLTWNDITGAGELAPGGRITITVTFDALKDTTEPRLGANGSTVNTASVSGAKADPDGPDGAIQAVIPMDDKSDNADVQIVNPTGLMIASRGVQARGSGVVISWETFTELKILGFNVLRTQDDKGFMALNSNCIVAQYAGANQGATYSFVDDSVTPGAVYEYALEILLLDGDSMVLRLPPVTANWQLRLPLVVGR